MKFLCFSVADVVSEAMEVDQKILFNIALGVSTTLECEGLAAYLDVDGRLVTNLKDRNKEPREIANQILKTWALRREATHRKLFDALHDCKLDSLQALIETFRDQLCKDHGKLTFQKQVVKIIEAMEIVRVHRHLNTNSPLVDCASLRLFSLLVSLCLEREKHTRSR